LGAAIVPGLPANVPLELLERVAYGRSLSRFAKAAWRYIDPDPLVWSWHMDAECEHLEAVSRGQIEKLALLVPPGTGKSLLVTLWEAWEWTWRPEGRWLCASYDQDLSTRDSLKCRSLMQSGWYQARWGEVFRLTSDENRKTYFSNDKKGWRLATSIGGHGTGEHPDRIVYDDLMSAQQAESEAERQAVRSWLNGTMSTRGAARGVRTVLIMQRLHEEDPAAHLLGQGGWESLVLPMRYERGRMGVTCLGWSDPRKVEGELLVPARYPEDVLQKIEAKLGPYGTAAQLQQRPSPATGGIFQRAWWRFWVPNRKTLPPDHPGFPPVVNKDGFVHHVEELPLTFEEKILSVDCSFKDELQAARKGQPPDPVSMGAWGRNGSGIYLLDRVNGVMDIETTASQLLAMSARHPTAVTKLIEDKANGPALMQILRHKVMGLTPVTPVGSKVQRVATAAKTERDRDARALSAVALVHAGNVYLPHPAIDPRVWDYIEQHASFPNGAHDDDVDMTSQALARIQRLIYRDERQDQTFVGEQGNQPPPETVQEVFRNRMAAAMKPKTPQRTINPYRR
jgi:predicted phage terminase large subunit-like protein